MTLKEFRQAIIESPNKDFFNEQQISVYLSDTGVNRNFVGFSSFFEYLENQIEGFRSLGDDIPTEFGSSLNHFVNLKTKIIEFLNSYSTSSNSSNLTPAFINNVEKFISNQQNIFEYDAPNTNFLLEIFNNKKNYYPGALNYITGRISAGAIQNREYLNGLILGYEYYQKGETEIKKRRDLEKSSLSRFRNHIDGYISNAEKDFIEHAFGLGEKSKNTIEEVEAYKTTKEKEYEKWFSETSSSFFNFDEVSKRKINDLEDLYREKLKLEAPAQYWNKRAASLRKEGYWWLGSLVVSILGGIGIFVFALQLLSDGVLEEIFTETANAIKWSVIFITLVSFLAFIIKTLSKLTFSTFHLVRDSEEREQLTYVFLAMQKEKAIDPTERHLIMQSLFSRADTGLLKDEGSPTMPGNIFDKMVANGK